MPRFSIDEINQLKKIKVFLCIPATGKSHLASVDSRFVDVDQEEALYKFDYDKNISQDEFSKLQGHGVVVRNDSEEYIHNKILEYLKNGKIILSATHKHIFKFLEEQNIPYVIIQYSVADIDYFKNRMRQRGNSEEFIEAMLGHREESYKKHKYNRYATAVIEISKDEFLSDVLWEIFGETKTMDFGLKNFYDTNLNLNLLDDAFRFYDLDEKYKQQANNCFQQVANNERLMNKFIAVYKDLFEDNSGKVRDFWKIKNIEDVFGNDAPAFVTNLMILLGMPFHKAKMQELKFDKKQIGFHKTRIKECFINDLELRGYKGIRISQMLWASYFMNCRIIEVGILQYEYDSLIDKIKIHIPPLSKLDFNNVKKSLMDSKAEIRKYFHLMDKQYICNSWLLSKQVGSLLDTESNIRKFQALFKIQEGEECVGDILNHVYKLKSCEDYEQLPEHTSLQRKIKTELKQGRIFKLGCGELI